MKKNTTLLLILVVLLGVAGYLFFFNDGDYVAAHIEQRDFAVKDTAKVNKIFIADSRNSRIVLERGADGLWMVNEKWVACQECVGLLLETFPRIKVKAPVPESAFETTVRSIAGKHVKVEIYQGEDEPAKIWYVGNPTKDHYGTYMLLENPGKGKSTVPFIMEVPGFYGFLTARFHTVLDEWRYKGIFEHRTNEIKALKFEWGEAPSSSFYAENVGNNKFKLSQPGQPGSDSPYDTLRFFNYLQHYEKIRLENFVISMEEAKMDSILSTPYWYRITLTEMDGNDIDVKLYKKNPRKDDPNPDGTMKEYDSEYMYAYINDDYMAIVQNFVFDPLLVARQTFQRSVSFVEN